VENGIPIVPYYDNKDDRELESLSTYLKGMIGVTDVREYNRYYTFYTLIGNTSSFTPLMKHRDLRRHLKDSLDLHLILEPYSYNYNIIFKIFLLLWPNKLLLPLFLPGEGLHYPS
jgi:hypothetical protein